MYVLKIFLCYFLMRFHVVLYVIFRWVNLFLCEFPGVNAFSSFYVRASKVSRKIYFVNWQDHNEIVASHVGETIL